MLCLFACLAASSFIGDILGEKRVASQKYVDDYIRGNRTNVTSDGLYDDDDATDREDVVASMKYLKDNYVKGDDFNGKVDARVDDALRTNDTYKLLVKTIVKDGLSDVGAATEDAVNGLSSRVEEAEKKVAKKVSNDSILEVVDGDKDNTSDARIYSAAASNARFVGVGDFDRKVVTAVGVALAEDEEMKDSIKAAIDEVAKEMDNIVSSSQLETEISNLESSIGNTYRRKDSLDYEGGKKIALESYVDGKFKDDEGKDLYASASHDHDDAYPQLANIVDYAEGKDATPSAMDDVRIPTLNKVNAIADSKVSCGDLIKEGDEGKEKGENSIYNAQMVDSILGSYAKVYDGEEGEEEKKVVRKEDLENYIKKEKVATGKVDDAEKVYSATYINGQLEEIVASIGDAVGGLDDVYRKKGDFSYNGETLAFQSYVDGKFTEDGKEKYLRASEVEGVDESDENTSVYNKGKVDGLLASYAKVYDYSGEDAEEKEKKKVARKEDLEGYVEKTKVASEKEDDAEKVYNAVYINKQLEDVNVAIGEINSKDYALKKDLGVYRRYDDLTYPSSDKETKKLPIEEKVFKCDKHVWEGLHEGQSGGFNVIHGGADITTRGIPFNEGAHLVGTCSAGSFDITFNTEEELGDDCNGGTLHYMFVDTSNGLVAEDTAAYALLYWNDLTGAIVERFQRRGDEGGYEGYFYTNFMPVAITLAEVEVPFVDKIAMKSEIPKDYVDTSTFEDTLSGYALKGDIPTIPDDLVTSSELSTYRLKDDLDYKEEDTLALKSQVDNVANDVAANYAKKEDLQDYRPLSDLAYRGRRALPVESRQCEATSSATSHVPFSEGAYLNLTTKIGTSAFTSVFVFETASLSGKIHSMPTGVNNLQLLWEEDTGAIYIDVDGAKKEVEVTVAEVDVEDDIMLKGDLDAKIAKKEGDDEYSIPTVGKVAAMIDDKLSPGGDDYFVTPDVLKSTLDDADEGYVKKKMVDDYSKEGIPADDAIYSAKSLKEAIEGLVVDDGSNASDKAYSASYVEKTFAKKAADGESFLTTNNIEADGEEKETASTSSKLPTSAKAKKLAKEWFDGEYYVV